MGFVFFSGFLGSMGTVCLAQESSVYRAVVVKHLYSRCNNHTLGVALGGIVA